MNPIKILADIMLEALKFFFSISHNYGVAIILLTAAVKIALYPLTLQGLQQMQALQALQPKIQEIQKKYKDNPQELQKKTIELYQKEKINPLGGCLPLLLQIPFFFALFFALTSKEFLDIVAVPGAQTTFLWMTNLSKPDPTYLMAILIGATTYLSQKTMPQAGGGGMAGMTYFMPIFIGVISAPFPAGLQLYWLAQNILTIGQQAYILKGRRG